jgi:hypothetical protein
MAALKVGRIFIELTARQGLQKINMTQYGYRYFCQQKV